MDKENRKKILLIYPHYSSFVRQDFEILSEKYFVDKYLFNISKKPFVFVSQFIVQFFKLLFTGWKYDFFYIWFADYHSLLPVLFSKLTFKKSIIIIGGYDAGRVRSLNYGAYNQKIRGFFAIQSIKNSTLNLGVSEYVTRKLKYIAPNANSKLLYNCISFNSGQSSSPKDKSVITVALVNSERTLYIKGIDTFIETARILRDVNFIIIGIKKDFKSALLNDLPGNIEIVEPVTHEDLVNFYQKASVYCQFSRIESFCLTLAEAMYFNCHPVITNNGALPEVAGGLGEVVPRHPALIAEAIKGKLNQMEGKIYRQYVSYHYSFEIRKEKLYSILNTLS
ncbi:MAG: glycosyltransferase family 4 protein [Prolixibacteraceae bacterium]|nr:glycosyltransferase family 4 protein [Prolixibacteraceae bacterium]